MSYSVRRHSARQPSVSSSSQAARGSPSRGWPTLPGLMSHSPPDRSSASPAAARVAGRRLALGADERQRDVRVADQADALGRDVEAQLGQQRAEHVLPDRVARAGVVEADAAPRPPRAAATRSHSTCSSARTSCVQRAASAAPRENSSSGSVAGDGEVVVAGEADRGVLAGQLAAVVRVGAVADDVAQAPELARARSRRCRRAPPRRRGGCRGCRRRWRRAWAANAQTPASGRGSARMMQSDRASRTRAGPAGRRRSRRRGRRAPRRASRAGGGRRRGAGASPRAMRFAYGSPRRTPRPPPMTTASTSSTFCAEATPAPSASTASSISWSRAGRRAAARGPRRRSSAACGRAPP